MFYVSVTVFVLLQGLYLGHSCLAPPSCTMADRPQRDRKPAKADKELVNHMNIADQQMGDIRSPARAAQRRRQIAEVSTTST